MKKLYALVLVIMVVMMSACSSVEIEEYKALQPAFVPEEFFNGKLSAHGVVRNRNGKVIRTFNADIKAWWEEGVGYLDETFIFNDGEEQQRTWKLLARGDGKYLASANDVVGETNAFAGGNAFRLEYTLLVKYRGRDIPVQVSDWMWRVSDDVVINHSVMKKFGLRIGDIHLTIIRESNP